MWQVYLYKQLFDTDNIAEIQKYEMIIPSNQ